MQTLPSRIIRARLLAGTYDMPATRSAARSALLAYRATTLAKLCASLSSGLLIGLSVVIVAGYSIAAIHPHASVRLPYVPGPTYALRVTVAGDYYVTDHDLTRDDCLNDLANVPSSFMPACI